MNVGCPRHQTSPGRPMDVHMKSGLHIDAHWTSEGRLMPTRWKYTLSLVPPIQKSIKLVRYYIQLYLSTLYFFSTKYFYVKVKVNQNFKKYVDTRSRPPEAFLGKRILKICYKVTGEHPCQSVISIKLFCNFKVALHFLLRIALDSYF